MKVFDIEVTPELRDNTVFVLAVALILVNVGHTLRTAYDKVELSTRIEKLDSRVKALEDAKNENGVGKMQMRTEAISRTNQKHARGKLYTACGAMHKV